MGYTNATAPSPFLTLDRDRGSVSHRPLDPPQVAARRVLHPSTFNSWRPSWLPLEMCSTMNSIEGAGELVLF